ncbi:sphingosine-1-phosphate lyase 1 [Octopus sinensis]|uniref:sphinganine-1-phosphate aldolase n=1 Tax=Octopus sinensis TaxID=2607531 RepID=A0A6P7SEF5_9MOLL|nr:sphingosine-1-phosphate lyase 1 [Octopus sinensis]
MNMASETMNLLMNPIFVGTKFIQEKINKLFEGKPAWQIVLLSCGTTIMVIKLHDLLESEEHLTLRIKRTLFKILRKVPAVQQKIDKSLKETAQQINESIKHSINSEPYVQVVPEKGFSSEDVMKEVERYRAYGVVDWKKGWCSGMIYGSNEELTKLLAKVYEIFAFSNPLHPEVFPDIRKMEAEIVRMTCNLFNGSSASCGIVTTGGTESIMLACLAYRNRAYSKGIKIPEIIAPKTAHAAFDKAAMVLRMRLTHIPVDPVTKKVDVNAMKRAINKNTCLLVGSAPQFPHGIIDPIAEISELGLKYNIPVHCDCCLGGFLVPFLEKAGFHMDPVDFRLPGVTSISADTHKYGQAPKGSAVLMYKDPNYRKFQWFSITNWPGGIYATPTFAGSRAGSEIASCWATMMFTGMEGYVDAAWKIISTARAMAKVLKNIHSIEVLGDPKMSVIAFTSKEFDIYRLSDALTAKGWTLNPLQFPASIHMCVTLTHTKPEVVERFEKDVAESVEVILQNPSEKCQGAGALYGMSQTIPDRSIVEDVTGIYLDASYDTTNH